MPLCSFSEENEGKLKNFKELYRYRNFLNFLSKTYKTLGFLIYVAYNLFFLLRTTQKNDLLLKKS